MALPLMEEKAFPVLVLLREAESHIRKELHPLTSCTGLAPQQNPEASCTGHSTLP
jgi:hypothetical protein